MRFFLGLRVGTLIAIAIAAVAVHVAFGDLRGLPQRDSARDTSADIAKTFDVSGFDSVTVGGVYNVDVNVGGSVFSVSLSGPPEDLARADVSVADGVLVLDIKDGSKRDGSWKDRRGLTAKVSMPSLKAFEASGVVDGSVEGVDAEAMSIRLSGVGDLDVKGKCGALSASLSGVGDLDAENLECKTASVTVSGAGKASVYATEKVAASVGGVGSIVVYGAPKEVSRSSSLFSSITVK
ncbi:MAG: DUF2807 domain-containing protein [Parvularculaceae bacterium]|nr:DUF2807 domain-containing protein [Parvularculaceae bacterium]